MKSIWPQEVRVLLNGIEVYILVIMYPLWDFGVEIMRYYRGIYNNDIILLYRDIYIITKN